MLIQSTSSFISKDKIRRNGSDQAPAPAATLGLPGPMVLRASACRREGVGRAAAPPVGASASPFEQEDEATFRLKFRKFRKALRYWLLWVTSTNQRSSFSYDNFVEWILGKKERKLTKKTFQFATCSF